MLISDLSTDLLLGVSGAGQEHKLKTESQVNHNQSRTPHGSVTVSVIQCARQCTCPMISLELDSVKTLKSPSDDIINVPCMYTHTCMQKAACIHM